MCRILSCYLVLLLTPVSIFAQEGGGAMLHGNGALFVNGAPLKDSSAVVAGDVIQTGDTGIAYLSAPGATLTLESNTIARLQSTGISIDRGSVSVATSATTLIFTRDFKISPTSGQWTEFYVTRLGGSIQIIARKNNLLVSCGTNSFTVKEGQQISRSDAPDCGLGAAAQRGAPPAGKGAILTSSTARDAALAAGGGLLLWTLLQSDNPVSPAIP